MEYNRPQAPYDKQLLNLRAHLQNTQLKAILTRCAHKLSPDIKLAEVHHDDDHGDGGGDEVHAASCEGCAPGVREEEFGLFVAGC